MTNTTPNNGTAWVKAINLPNNSFFVSRVYGFSGSYLFGATYYSAMSVARETGGNLVRVAKEDGIDYWVIARKSDRALSAAAYVRSIGAVEYKRQIDEDRASA